MIQFPQKSDYPDAFEILENPEKDVKLYVRMVVSSAFAYFDSDPITRFLFKKRFYQIDNFLRQNNHNHFNKALDVGTGVGFFIPALSSYADEVVALDYSDDILKYVNTMVESRKLKNVTTLRGDILKLPFADNSFDLVICMSVLEHFNPLEEPLKGLKRILRPGGLLVIGYPSETKLFRFLHQKVLAVTTAKGRIVRKYLDAEQSDKSLHAPHVSTGAEIAKTVRSVGLKEVCSKAIKLIPPFFELYRIHFLQKFDK